MHEKNKYRHIPWNRYNLEKYRDTDFWSYRPALLSIHIHLCCSSLASTCINYVKDFSFKEINIYTHTHTHIFIYLLINLFNTYIQQWFIKYDSKDINADFQ